MKCNSQSNEAVLGMAIHDDTADVSNEKPHENKRSFFSKLSLKR